MIKANNRNKSTSSESVAQEENKMSFQKYTYSPTSFSISARFRVAFVKRLISGMPTQAPCREHDLILCWIRQKSQLYQLSMMVVSAPSRLNDQRCPTSRHTRLDESKIYSTRMTVSHGWLLWAIKTSIGNLKWRQAKQKSASMTTKIDVTYSKIMSVTHCARYGMLLADSDAAILSDGPKL